jgi:hypothetical protein
MSVSISPTYEEVMARADALAAQFPESLSCRTIGLSEEGRPIPMLTVGDPGRDCPLLMVTGGTHGSEETGRAAALAFAEWLAGEGREALDGLSALVVPCVNPDGAELNSYHNARDVNLYHCHSFAGPATTAEGRAVEQVAREHLPDCLVDVHGLAGGAMGDSGFVIPMLCGEYGLVIALGVTEELCEEGRRLGFPQRHPFIEGLLRETEAPLVEKLARTSNALTYTMEITENYYPLEDSVRSGLGRLRKLVEIAGRAQYCQPYPGFPCDVLAGGPTAALMAFGSSYRKRRESRVKLATLVQLPEVYFERSHADPGGVATVVLRVPSELTEAPEGLVLQCALDRRVTIRRVGYEWPDDAAELPPGGLDMEHGYHVWRNRGILMVRASIARRAGQGEHRLAVEYEAPFAPHVRPRWRVFSNEGPGTGGRGPATAGGSRSE